jgi:hypothetical protein
MPYDAFISYSSRDKATADATCAALEAAGIRCWIAPRDILPGADWGEAIVLAINSCRVMILIFSANANESPQIRREVERAVSKGLPIVPVRIEAIAPSRSLEYFIATVHWLDALTPPLEEHLRRLAETVKTLLQIDPVPPRIATPDASRAAPVAAKLLEPKGFEPKPLEPKHRMVAALVAVIVLVVGAASFGFWRFLSPAPVPGVFPSPSPSAPLPSPASPAAPVRQASAVESAMVGTFARDAVHDDYDWHYVYSVAADGTYRLTSTQDEYGTFQAGNGRYRTVAGKTGRARTGTYRAVGSDAIEIVNAGGTFVFHPMQPTAPLNPANPLMLGVWQENTIQGGVPWVLTIQNNPDGTYHYEARAEDSGSATIGNQQWRRTSSVTGEARAGTYRVVDANSVEITGPEGPAVWRRQ